MPGVGIPLDKPPAEFDCVRHVEFFEGPLISEFHRRPGNEPYLFIWRARDTQYNRWLVIRITKRELTLYESCNITLKDLIEHSVQAFLADVNGEGVFCRWWSVVVEQLPENYIPSDDSYHDPDLRLEDQQWSRPQAILIDGEWDLQDIIDYPRRYRDIYAAEYLLSSSAKNGPRDDYFKYLLNGYAYKTFFEQLSGNIPRNDRARVKTFNYASPGIIEIDLHAEVADAVVHHIRALTQVIEETTELYNKIHQWHLAQGDQEHGKRPSLPTEQIYPMVRALAQNMGFVDLNRLHTLTNGDVNQTIRILLALFRRAKLLVNYEVSGKAQLISSTDGEINHPERFFQEMLDRHRAFDGIEPTYEGDPDED